MSGSETIRAILGAGGRLARVRPGYEERPQQLELAEAALAALRDEGYAMVEAGTGTGKTLGYLVPALLSGKKVVISTATKTLQDQIFFKDIPLLARALGTEISAAYMKGRSNYLCLLRYESFSEAPKFASRQEAQRWPLVQAWAESTESGDRAELSLPEESSIWKEITSTSERCLGQKCAHWDRCYVTEMRRKAQEARLVVVNHHLFFADAALRAREEIAPAGAGAISSLAQARAGALPAFAQPPASPERVQQSRSWGLEVIPRYDAVVFDEAHALEEVATGHFGVQISTYRFQELAQDARRAFTEATRGLLEALVAAVEGRAAGFFSALEERSGLLFSARKGNEVVRLAEDLAAVERDELLAALEQLADATEEDPDPELEAIARRARAIAEDLAFATAAEEGSPYVHFVERRGRGLFLKAAPIEIAKELAKRVWSSLPAAVFTSATLAVDGRLDHLRGRLGLASREAFEERLLASPFDYRRQSALYLPTHLPEPSDPSFIDRAALELERLFALSGGRAFALFTSFRNMTRAWELLEPRLPYRVLVQGQLPKAQILERFVEEPSVLFATASFWEGVDVPGEALSLVAIDRLPFASPADPLVAARVEALKKRGIEPFSAYQVPQAVIGLRQGFGRLIRSRGDRGIVAILDKRIVQKGYGRQFLRTLPEARRTGRLEELKAIWDELQGSRATSPSRISG